MAPSSTASAARQASNADGGNGSPLLLGEREAHLVHRAFHRAQHLHPLGHHLAADPIARQHSDLERDSSHLFSLLQRAGDTGSPVSADS
jgi:hypothetical protein